MLLGVKHYAYYHQCNAYFVNLKNIAKIKKIKKMSGKSDFFVLLHKYIELLIIFVFSGLAQHRE